MKRLILCLLILTACSGDPAPELTEFSGIRMTILFRVLVAGNVNSNEVQAIINGVFEEVDEHFNDWNPDSEISRLARHPAQAWHPLSPTLNQHLLQIDALVAETEGRFDPSVGSRARCWKKALQRGELPEAAELAEQSIGWQHIELHDGSIHCDVEGLSLDLGGIAKGLAIDMISQGLQRAGYQDHYVEWGGELRVHGLHPSGRPWQIEIRDISGGENKLLSLSDAAVATSGDYLQSWEVEGTLYSHILDPRSGEPLRPHSGGISSVTVVADSAVRADALATAAMLFPSVAEAEAWANERPNAQFYFQTQTN